MLIEDIFDEIFLGINLNKYISEKGTCEIYTFNKNNILNNKLLDAKVYNDFLNIKLQKKYISKAVKEKFLLQINDIIISIKKPYKVFLYTYIPDKNIVIPNNYIVLRGIKTNKFTSLYISYYLEWIGIDKFIKENTNRFNTELTIEDIKSISIPFIPIEEQNKKSMDIHKLQHKMIEYEMKSQVNNTLIKDILNQKN